MKVIPRLSSVLAVGLAVLLAAPNPAAAKPGGWSATWTASPQRPSTSYTPNWAEEGFADQTIRQVVRISAGGSTARIRLSNVFGSTPLKIAGATVARASGGAAVQGSTLRHLTSGGKRAFTVPAGAELATDAVPIKLSDLDSVAVTLYLSAPTGPATYHAQAIATDHRADPSAAAFTQTTVSWYYLSGVDVIGAASRRGTVVAFGDSLTDGYGSTPGSDNRYPDELAERLAAAGKPRGVVNQGIGGNRVTVDSARLGDKGVSRFRRDVLGQPGVRTVIILEGLNDIGMSEVQAPINAPFTEVSADQIIAGHRDLIRQAKTKGLRVLGATLPPTKGSRYHTPTTEAKREAVNAWIRTSGAYDAVVDLDRALASPADEDQVNPDYLAADRLHLNDAGYRAMANAVDPADLG
ncbi:SGNH/GDSL hydrolase family protein [Nonomuraea longicatena]|uniref:SGNH/GDSL hydrolase family protein n=1 Tax=Nonomuraea longicatena TaxID=83682 RepID=A0ABN1QQY5_9ACTN